MFERKTLQQEQEQEQRSEYVQILDFFQAQIPEVSEHDIRWFQAFERKTLQQEQEQEQRSEYKKRSLRLALKKETVLSSFITVHYKRKWFLTKLSWVIPDRFEWIQQLQHSPH